MHKITKKEKIRYTSIAISVLILIFFILSLVYYSTLTQEYAKLGEGSLLIIFLTTIFLEGFPQLISAAVILAGVILSGAGSMSLVFMVAFGSFAGSVFGYYLGYAHGEHVARSLFPKAAIKSQKIRLYLRHWGKIAIAIIAITPLPYFPVLFGTINVKPKTFLLYGATVRAVSYIVYGYILLGFVA